MRIVNRQAEYISRILRFCSFSSKTLHKVKIHDEKICLVARMRRGTLEQIRNLPEKLPASSKQRRHNERQQPKFKYSLGRMKLKVHCEKTAQLQSHDRVVQPECTLCTGGAWPGCEEAFGERATGSCSVEGVRIWMLAPSLCVFVIESPQNGRYVKMIKRLENGRDIRLTESPSCKQCLLRTRVHCYPHLGRGHPVHGLCSCAPDPASVKVDRGGSRPIEGMVFRGLSTSAAVLSPCSALQSFVVQFDGLPVFQ